MVEEIRAERLVSAKAVDTVQPAHAAMSRKQLTQNDSYSVDEVVEVTHSNSGTPVHAEQTLLCA
jgi:hypothetical protein